ncbi:MAG: HoxN/HupN/NixA family nickel/cobalt transporter [Acidiphilium sp.]
MSRARMPTGRIVASLVGVNVLAWGWAFAAFGARPGLLAMAGLAWVFGLRHAIDADHVAAIDNAVRKLAGEGRPARLVGLFFSLGHSTVVVILAAVAALAAGALHSHLHRIEMVGSYLGTAISAGFLVIIAAGNVMALRRDGDGAAPAGVLSRLLRPVLGCVRRDVGMYPVGFLFGLGFDTATEIGLLALSAAGAAHGLAFWRSMALPALFTAGMALLDTADSALMSGAYAWALREPARRRRYNMVLTSLSVVVALLIGGIELLGLFAGKGWFWAALSWLNGRWSELGACVCFTLALAWPLFYRRGSAADAR